MSESKPATVKLVEFVKVEECGVGTYAPITSNDLPRSFAFKHSCGRWTWLDGKSCEGCGAALQGGNE